MAKSYIVIGACAMAKTSTAQGPRVLTFLEGATLPGDVDQDSLDHLLDVGLIAVEGSDEAEQAGPSGQQPQTEPPPSDSTGGTPPRVMVAGDDPAMFTAPEVVAFLDAPATTDDERERVLSAEAAGKNRSTVVNHSA